MKILLTFEHSHLVLHFIDVVRMLKHRGHTIDYYSTSASPMHDDYKALFAPYMNFLTNLEDYQSYDLWMYDLCSWEGPTSPLVPLLETYNGQLICLGNGDGAGFCVDRMSVMARKKTSLFMRNTLFKDLRFYPEDIHSKLMLSTCYITNSQQFKKSAVPFLEKRKRAIFTGSLTGFTMRNNPEDRFCRIKVPMTLIENGIPCVYRLHNHNPQWKEEFENRVPKEYQVTALTTEDYIKEMETSMIVLALRGNYHTVNRFFEGQASGGLVFTTRFKEEAEYLGHGEPGVHYVEIECDGSDVVEKAKYYLSHPEEAAVIASNGRKLWEEWSMLDDNNLLPQKVMDYYSENIKRIGGIQI